MSLPHGNISSVEGVLPRPGTRPKRVLSRRELIRLGRSPRRVDALLMSFSAWMADRKPRPLRPLTRYSHVSKIRKAFAVCGGTDHSFIAGDIRTVRFVLGSVSPHPSTQNTYITAFRLFFDFLEAQGMRRSKTNPAREIGRPPALKTLPRPIGIDDVCAYLDAAHRLGVVHYAIASLGLYMGLRRGEIVGCQWAWFFQADGRWWCDVTGKGGKRDRKVVHPEVHRALQCVRESHRDSTWVFPSTSPVRRGESVGISTIVRYHRQILDEAGIEHATLHQLRHSFATYLRKVRAPSGRSPDVADVQKALGHSSIQSTQIYSEVLDDDHAELVESLDFRAIRDEMRLKRQAREQERTDELQAKRAEPPSA